MKRQYIRLFSFLIGITFVISGILFSFVNEYKKDKKQRIADENVIADEIGDVYEAFYKKEKELSKYRDELLEDVKEFSAYFAGMPEGYETIVPKLDEYETQKRY